MGGYWQEAVMQTGSHVPSPSIVSVEQSGEQKGFRGAEPGGERLF